MQGLGSVLRHLLKLVERDEDEKLHSGGKDRTYMHFSHILEHTFTLLVRLGVPPLQADDKARGPHSWVASEVALGRAGDCAAAGALGGSRGSIWGCTGGGGWNCRI